MTSVPTSLAVFWGEDIERRMGADARKAGIAAYDYIGSNAPAEQLLQSLSAASDRLTADFGTWKTPWGDINRFQRLNDDIVPTFTDAGAEHPRGLYLLAVGLAGFLRVRAHTREQRSGMAPAATASLPWSSLATACGRGQ